MSAATITSSVEAPVTIEDINRILADPKSKEFKDLRDRAAYMYLTGTYPSHLRTFFTRALTIIRQMHTTPLNPGPMHLNQEMTDRLSLDDHPMVLKVREYIDQGYKIRVSKGPNQRKPYTKIFLYKGPTQLTVKIDGYIKDGWD